MITPVLAWSRILRCFLLGFSMGPAIDLVRPLHSRLPLLSQPAACLTVFAGWLYLVFGICEADIRWACLFSASFGYGLWYLTLSQLFLPLTAGFWRGFAGLLGLIFGPVHTFFQKIWHFSKKNICI